MNVERQPPETAPPHQAAMIGWFSRYDRGTFQTSVLAVIAGVLILAALGSASLIAVPTVLALLCAIALAPSVRWLERTGARASLCAAIVVGSLLLGVAVTTYALAPSAEAWNERAPQILREMERRAREIASGYSLTEEVTPSAVISEGLGESMLAPPSEPPVENSSGDAVGKLVEEGQLLLADWVIGAPRVAAGAAFWAMLTFFLLRDRVMLARLGMSLATGASARRDVGRAMRDVRTNVTRYLLAITAINLGVGVCTAVAFYLLGVENAPLWGVAAALLNFMPFIGATLMALVTLGVGIASFEDPIIAFAPFAVVVAVNVIESQIVTPTVVGSRIRIAPIAVFLAIAFGAWLWGAGGALVATPTLIVAVAFARRLKAAPRLSLPLRQRVHRQKGSTRQ